MKVNWYNKNSLYHVVKRKVMPVNTVLDIGCGIRPQRIIKPKIHICCEPYDEYVSYLLNDISKKIRCPEYIILKATWSESVRILPPKSIDTVFLIDVIEHLEKDEGMKLLKLTENIARIQVIVFTPYGFLSQSHPEGKDAWGLNGGKWQEHKSGWIPEDFDSSYEICASKDFHEINNLGESLKSSHGAFWAIKTIKEDKKTLSIRYWMHIWNSCIVESIEIIKRKLGLIS